MIIRQANKSEAGRLASLHQDNIKNGFLSQLGHSFLELLYQELLASSGVLCLVAEENGLITGYICGCENTPAFYRDFLRRKFIPASQKLFSKALKPSVIRGVYENLKHARQAEVSSGLPTPELISLAVAADFRRAGVGAELVLALAAEFDRRAIAEFKVVVGSSLLTANAFYKKMGFDLVGTTKVHAGEVSNIFTADTGFLLKSAIAGGNQR